METLDTRGDICPIPLLKTVDKIEQVAEKTGVRVLSDHPPAKRSIPLEMEKRGYKAKVKESGPEFEIIITPG